MPAKSPKNIDYESLRPSAEKKGLNGDDFSLRPSGVKKDDSIIESLVNPRKKIEQKEIVPSEIVPTKIETVQTEFVVAATNNKVAVKEITYAEETKQKKEEKKAEKDRDLLDNERWLKRNGHTLTYAGLYIFSILVFFRPYELIPGLGFLSSSFNADAGVTVQHLRK